MKILHKSSAFSASILFILGEGASKVAPFLLLPYFTNVKGASFYGEFALLQSIAVVLAVIIGFSQDGAISRFNFVYGKNSVGALIFLAIINSLMISICMFFLMCLFNARYISSVILALSMFYSLLIFRYLQFNLMASRFFYLNVVSAILTILFSFILINENVSDPKIFIYGLSLSHLLVSFISIVLIIYNDKLSLRRVIRKRYFSKVIFCYFLSIGFPTVIHQLGFVVRGHADRLIIDNFFSSEQLGVYVAAFQLASVLSVVIVALNKYFVVGFYSKLKNDGFDKDIFQKKIAYSFLFSILIYFIALNIPDEIYLLLGAEFISVAKFLPTFVLSVSLSIPYLMCANLRFYFKQNYRIMMFSLGATVIHLVFIYLFSRLSLTLVPWGGVISSLVLIFFIRVKNNEEFKKA